MLHKIKNYEYIVERIVFCHLLSISSTALDARRLYYRILEFPPFYRLQNPFAFTWKTKTRWQCVEYRDVTKASSTCLRMPKVGFSRMKRGLILCTCHQLKMSRGLLESTISRIRYHQVSQKIMTIMKLADFYPKLLSKIIN